MTTDYTDYPGFDPDGNEVIAREVVEHEKAATDRSVARRVALQALYEIDSTNHLVGDVIQHHIDFDIEARRVKTYIHQLVMSVVKHRDHLDRILQQYAPEWPFQQVATIDRNILRLALYEMAIDKRIPVSVAIDEAIELAKLFGAEGTSRFVNGVLGTISVNVDNIRMDLAKLPAFSIKPMLPPDQTPQP